MAESLREITDQTPGSGVPFLSQQADVIAQRQEPLKIASGFPHASLHGAAIGKPASADQERAFIRPFIIAPPSPHEPILAKDAFGGIDCPCDSRISDGQKTNLRQARQARVDLLGTEPANEAANGSVETFAAYSCVHFIAQRLELMTPRGTNGSGR
jgi:hypothetical protein